MLILIYILEQWRTDKETSKNATENISISIIIPVRNEEDNIGACIQSILNNNGFSAINPQLIIVDDHSTDNTVEIVESFASKNITLLKLSEKLNNQQINAYKKAAINFALSEAEGDYIIQLDGDVCIDESYLETIVENLKSYQYHFVAAPVVINPGQSILSRFQSLDMSGMMALTKAGINSKKWYLANGANMIYQRGLIEYDEQGIASGDDVFGIQKIAGLKDSSISFLNDSQAFVFTNAQFSYRSFYQQRIRWSTKNKLMKGAGMWSIMVVPYLNAQFILLTLILSLFLTPLFVPLLIFHFFIKMSIDYIYLSELTKFYGNQKAMKLFVVSEIFHVLYLSVIGTMSLFVKQFNWKSREVS